MRKTTWMSWLGASALLAVTACQDEGDLNVTQRACEAVEELAFGEVSLRTVSHRSVRMENCGAYAIEALTARVEVQGEDADADTFFVPPATVAVPVVPEQRFSIPLAFRPVQVGEQTATLVVEDTTDAEEPVEIARVALRGTGVDPAVCLLADPAALSFDTTLVGEARTEHLTFTNVGGSSCTPSGLGVRAGAEHFAVIGAVPEALAAGETFGVDVVFAPLAEGTLEGSAAVVLAGREEVTVALSGTGALDRRCTLEGPAPAVFPRAAAGFSSSATRFDVTNVGLADCTLGAASVDNGEFSLDGGLSAGTVLAPGAAAAVDMTFTPAAAGQRQATLSIPTVDGAIHAVALAAYADPEPGCVLGFNPPVVAFADTAVGLERAVPVSATNLGTVACTVGGADVDDSAYSFASAPPPGVYGPGESFSFELRFAPLQEATSLGTVTIDVAEPGAPELAVYGRAGRGDLVFQPPLAFFGGIIEGCASEQVTLTLANVGDAPARIDGLLLSAESDPNFEVLTDLAGQELAAGQIVNVHVRMLGDPSLATHHAELRAQATGAKVPSVAAELYGESLSAALADHDEGFVQQQIPQVDILFVIDNSGSMAEEQANLAANFDSFISFTDQLDIDYHVGITTTDTTVFGQSGAFVAPYIQNRGVSPTPDPVFAFNAAAQVGTGGAGVEQGFRAAFEALTPPVITGANAGFLRPDALLSIVFVSDEEDQSDGSVSDFIERFLAVKDYRPDRVVASAIAGTLPFGCGSAEAGTRYAAMATALNGVFASICDESFAEAMEDIGLTTFEALSSFDLEAIPEPSSLVVTLTRASTGVTEIVPEDDQNGWSFVPERRVRFHGTWVPAPGDVVSIAYTAQCIAP